MTNLSIYTDGGSRGNPGPSASAFVVYDSQNQIVFEQGRYIGITTNNQAEYQAVLFALTWLSTSQYTTSQVTFYLDSLLVASQLNGTYKIKDENLKKIYLEINNMIRNSKLEIVNFVHIPRAQNSRADFIVNQTLDSSI